MTTMLRHLSGSEAAMSIDIVQYLSPRLPVCFVQMAAGRTMQADNSFADIFQSGH
jgi:hypothetical protein